MSLITEDFIVTNLKGLHLRVATKIANEVMQSGLKARIIKDGSSADASSPMEILTLAIQAGSKIRVEVKGKDAKKLIETIKKVVSNE